MGLGYHQAPERPTLPTTPAKPSPIGGLLLPGWLEARQNCPGGDPLDCTLLGAVWGPCSGLAPLQAALHRPSPAPPPTEGKVGITSISQRRQADPR